MQRNERTPHERGMIQQKESQEEAWYFVTIKQTTRARGRKLINYRSINVPVIDENSTRVPRNPSNRVH